MHILGNFIARIFYGCIWSELVALYILLKYDTLVSLLLYMGYGLEIRN